MTTVAVRKRAGQVDSEAFLRYAPQRGALAEALSDARSRRSQQRGAASATARGVQQVAGQADTQVREAYAPALQQAMDDRVAVDADLQGLPSASFFKTAASVGGRQAETRLAGALARAREGLVSRQVEASSGEAFAKRQADAEFGQTVGTLRQRGFDLSSQEGAFRASRSGQLQGEATGRAFKAGEAKKGRSFRAAEAEKGRTFSAGQQAERLANSGKKGAKGSLPGGVKPVAPSAQGALKDSVTTARATIAPVVAKLISGGMSAAEAKETARKIYTTGRSGSTSFDEAAYTKMVNDGVPPVDARRRATTKNAAIAKLSPLALRVALDLEVDKHITHDTVRELWQRGYGARAIGRTKKPVRRAGARPPLAPGANGQLRPT